MSIYHQRGQIEDVEKQYKLLRRELKRLLNITPSQKTRALYDTFTSG